MTDEATAPNVEMRDGKLYVGDDCYFQGMIRHLILEAADIRLSKSFDFDPLEAEDGSVVSDSIGGTANIIDDTLSIIGDDNKSTRTLPYRLDRWKKIEPGRDDWTEDDHDDEGTGENREKFPYSEGYVVVGFIDADFEIGNPAEFYIQCYLQPSVFEELQELCRQDRLESLSFIVESDLWVNELDQHVPPSVRMTWYLAPGEYRTASANGRLTSINWSEKGLSLKSRESD